MPAIVEFPAVVQQALDHYGDLFANDCQRRHFAEYLTGLLVAERKTVLGINGEFARTTDQSCLNRYLTEAPWDVLLLNQREGIKGDRRNQRESKGTFLKIAVRYTTCRRMPSPNHPTYGII